ncbi:hypothetical protein Srut_51910 [Streptomyces rutgersensis]|nr:hypothetical protein Srut_51910 [Streptomyces rutgersensis]
MTPAFGALIPAGAVLVQKRAVRPAGTPARRETPFPPAGTAGVDPTGGLDSARVDTGDGGPVRGHGRIAAPR